MGIVIGPLEFEGPYADARLLKEEPGLYAILCESKGELELVEFDESHSVRNCLDAEEYTSNRRFFVETCQNNLVAAVHYTPQLSRDERRHMKMRLMEEFE